MTDMERDVLAKARAGDASAFGWLVDRYWGVVVKSVRRLVRDVHAAEDAAQEAFLRAMSHLHRLDGEIRFEGWVVRIARNIAVDRVRRSRLCPELDMGDLDDVPLPPHYEACDGADVTSSSTQTTGSSADRVWEAVHALPARERKMLLLRYVRGMTQQEVAEECGLSVGAVKVMLYRTRHRIRGLVETS